MKQSGIIIYWMCALLCCISIAACKKEQATPLTVAFSYAIVDSNFTSPVKVNFSNTTTGATHYKWTFTGGTPSTSDKQDPGTIVFDSTGNCTATLEAWNNDYRASKQIELLVDSSVTIAFDPQIQINDFAPADVAIVNNSAGGSSYAWTFDGGEPASSNLQHPGVVHFATAGEHTITLVINNGRKNFTLTKKITLQPVLQPAFTIQPAEDDNDYEAPLTATLVNETTSGLHWQWTVSGNGVLSNTTARQPTVYFDGPGTYTVTLTAGNDKETKNYQQTITVLPNTNLRHFTDIRFGINTAQRSVGCYFSTKLQRHFTSADDLTTVGKDIDLVFFGLNKNFVYNRFVSPDSAASYTFDPIPGAQPVTVINSQELCGCSASLTETEFDAMTNDALLAGIPIDYSAGGWMQFSNTTVPRIMLFKTSDGRKGAVKIKQFVQQDADSYIITDIKVQKSR